MAKEILLTVEAVANEKEVDREVIFGAVEFALEAATRKRFTDQLVDVRVDIDRKTGEYVTHRIWQIVDDDAILDNPATQMREMVARVEFANQELTAGDFYEELIDNEVFGRIDAQSAKQNMISKLREAEREKIYQKFIDKQGQLIHGIVRRFERGNVILDIDGVEATILKGDMIPRDNFKLGDRIRGYLAKVNREIRGPQLQVSRIAPEFLVHLISLEVPEISMGSIEVMGVARDPGFRAKIAVRAFDPRIDAVGACVGIKASRVQVVINELAGERIDIVLWDEDPKVFVRKAMAPAEVLDSFINYDDKTIDLAVTDDKLAQAVGRNGQNVRLACDLTGWQINVLSASEFKNKIRDQAEIAPIDLAEILDVDKEIADKLQRAGYASAEAISLAEIDDLVKIDGFDEEIAEAIVERASDYLFMQAMEEQDDVIDEMQKPIADMEIAEEIKQVLIDAGLVVQEDIADLSTDELIEITNMDKQSAQDLITLARAPWFSLNKGE